MFKFIVATVEGLAMEAVPCFVGWVTFFRDSYSLFNMSSGYFWLGGGRLDDLVGISWGAVTPVTMC